jgi:hypothetical protein
MFKEEGISVLLGSKAKDDRSPMLRFFQLKTMNFYIYGFEQMVNHVSQHIILSLEMAVAPRGLK